MRFTTFFRGNQSELWFARAVSAIDQLRLQPQCREALECNGDVLGRNLDAVTYAAELLAGNERGARAAEGIVDRLASAATVGDHTGHQFHRLGRRVEVADV